MTKKSPSRLLKDSRRNFNAQEVLELTEMTRLANARRHELGLIKQNTALVPRGQEVVQELEGIVNLLDNARNIWVSQKLKECGWEGQVFINLSTGEITEQNNEPSNGSETTGA